jgi:hypothetical protein
MIPEQSQYSPDFGQASRRVHGCCLTKTLCNNASREKPVAKGGTVGPPALQVIDKSRQSAKLGV